MVNTLLVAGTAFSQYMVLYTISIMTLAGYFFISRELYAALTLSLMKQIALSISGMCLLAAHIFTYSPISANGMAKESNCPSINAIVTLKPPFVYRLTTFLSYMVRFLVFNIGNHSPAMNSTFLDIDMRNGRVHMYMTSTAIVMCLCAFLSF